LTQENSRSDQKALIMPKTKKTKKGGSRPSDYFPDMDQWPNDWMGIEEDLEIGRGLLALFTPFIQHLIDEGLGKKTITNHGCHLCMLGREIVERLNDVDEENRKLSPRELILHYVDQEGGPLLSFWDPNDKTELAHHMAYDATCRKLLKFL
jgi:hypothetical protein